MKNHLRTNNFLLLFRDIKSVFMNRWSARATPVSLNAIAFPSQNFILHFCILNETFSLHRVFTSHYGAKYKQKPSEITSLTKPYVLPDKNPSDQVAPEKWAKNLLFILYFTMCKARRTSSSVSAHCSLRNMYELLLRITCEWINEFECCCHLQTVIKNWCLRCEKWFLTMASPRNCQPCKSAN